MTLKTSSFKINKTILKKNLFRFWPIWGLYLVILIFMMPVSLYNSIVRYGNGATAKTAIDKTVELLNVIDNTLQPVLIAVFAVVAAVAVFSYLYSARSCNMMHAFPIKRTELFATHYISGFFILILPQFAVFLGTMLMCAVNQIEGLPYLVMWLLLSLGLSFFFYSMAVFCCMLTGHFLPGFAFFAFFNVVYVVFFQLLTNLTQQISYGLGNITGSVGTPGAWLSPAVYLSSVAVVGPEYFLEDVTDRAMAYGSALEPRTLDATMHGALPVALYCIVGAVLVGLAVFLYSKRNLECAAEMTAHRFVKPMTRWMVTIVVSLALAFLFTGILFDSSKYFEVIFAVSWVVISFVCFFALEMAINKKFKIFKKKRFLEWALCAVILVLTVGLLEGDVFKLEKKQPQPEEVKAMVVQANHEMVLTEEDEIAQMMEIHRDIIYRKHVFEAYEEAANADMENEELQTGYVRFTYIMKDGEKFVRSYYIPCDINYMTDAENAASKIRKMQMDTNSYMKEWMVVNYDAVELVGGFFYNYQPDGESETIISKEDIQVLYEAMQKDIAENNIGCYFGARQVSDELEEEYYNCYIRLMGVMEEEPMELWRLIDSLYSEQKENGIQIPSMGATAEDSYVDETYQYFSIQPGQYAFETGFDVNSYCKHTVQALIDLEIIESIDEIRYQEEKEY